MASTEKKISASLMLTTLAWIWYCCSELQTQRYCFVQQFHDIGFPLSFSHCLVDEKRWFLTIQQSVNKWIIVNGMFQTDPSIFPRGQHWLTCHKVGDSQKLPFGKNRGAGLWYSIYHHLPSGKLSHSELENHHVSQVNQLFLWPFSIVMGQITRGYPHIFPWFSHKTI